VKVLDGEVRSIMTPKVVTCVPEDHVSAIMAVMTQRRIRHIESVDGLSPTLQVPDALTDSSFDHGILRTPKRSFWNPK
jgi:predicted transcriptional regulator